MNIKVDLSSFVQEEDAHSTSTATGLCCHCSLNPIGTSVANSAGIVDSYKIKHIQYIFGEGIFGQYFIF